MTERNHPTIRSRRSQKIANNPFTTRQDPGLRAGTSHGVSNYRDSAASFREAHIGTGAGVPLEYP